MTMLCVLAERAQCLVASPALLQAHGHPAGPADRERLPSMDLGQPQDEHDGGSMVRTAPLPRSAITRAWSRAPR
ncbi:hypothetical protein FB549_2545 [Delftia sp. HK171]|nr:hypothetical protein FB549_2545 [Delftia sp. HK171]